MSSLTVNANVPKENPIIQATFWNLRKAHLNWHHTEGRYCGTRQALGNILRGILPVQVSRYSSTEPNNYPGVRASACKQQTSRELRVSAAISQTS
ncbi:hypothetical protein OOU_Y34scaffold00275g7 [Pyricularia oryzae Y34]|uniref:Uncharacterized protein n=3 Tax=Pyricularia oryzae TaxID=318829 RepID=Q2KF58_PYRO7|nr:hypothetical protein MGCH7_ch7g828 [Pyricularia oryzae 70-15]ELQ41491.1 hypothetical protein OOU_Y34scaffold00275g7 [Pyricularia oryzae Y34]